MQIVFYVYKGDLHTLNRHMALNTLYFCMTFPVISEFIIGDAHNNVLHQVIELRINIIFYAKKLLNFK